jgi:ATP-dependent DNA helicase RecG
MGGLILTYYADVRTQLQTEQVDEKLIKIIEYVSDNGSITNSEIQKLLNVSKPTATRLLKQSEQWLVSKNIGRKGIEYRFIWDKLSAH